MGAIGCKWIACGAMWMQMVVDTGEGKEIRKKETYSVGMADASHVHRLWLQMRVLRKEKKLTKCEW